MKISNAVAIVAVAALATAGFAQGRPPMGGPGGRQGGGFRPRDPKEVADQQTQRATEALGLSPAQQAKAHAIYLKGAMDQKRIRDAQTAAIKKLLTPDQAKKMEGMRGFGGGPGGPGGRGPGGPGGAMGRGGPRPGRA